MQEPARYAQYKEGTLCSVPGCTHSAEYEVYLYDYYDSMNEEFFEQDFTCPFVCEKHMNENELRIDGERQPRASPRYPYTNRQWAQGYTKYKPISEIFPLIYSASTLARGSILVESVAAINDELISYLAKHPELMYKIDPRKFEELVAELLARQGYTPTLTPRTRDGGYDIMATRSDSLGDHLYLVECKRYAPENKVGVAQVRGIYGVAKAHAANKAVLVTTSSFSCDALAFATPLKYDLALHDHASLKNWLSNAERATKL